METIYLIQGIPMLCLRLWDDEFRMVLLEDIRKAWFSVKVFLFGQSADRYAPLVDLESVELRPNYLFMNSELNQQLVYAILHGISLVHKLSRAAVDTFCDITIDREMKNLKILSDGNVRLSINHYIIYKENESKAQSMLDQNKGLRVESKVDILFYRYESFSELFDIYDLDMCQVEQSLNPFQNRQQVF
jgi:hypothetical protein